jgi:glycosyltransferase involved in cell wall biosynthesis
MSNQAGLNLNLSIEGDACPFVSVIIPVLNDAKRLHRCLSALSQQTYSARQYEIIVVDNGSAPEENIADVVAQFEQTIAAFERFPSSFAARNTGIAIANGSVIAFTDADCIPAPDWIEQGVKALLQSENCGLVAGSIDLFFADPQQATPVELYESITAFPQKQLVEQQQFAATANVFTFRQVFDRVGRFDPHLKSSGDIEWGKRVAAFGYRQIYAEAVRVQHPARRSIAQLYQRTVRLAGGLYDLLNHRTQDSLLRRNLLYLKTLIANLVPPVNFALNVFFNSKLEKWIHKLQVSLIMVFVRYVSASELIRLKLGGVSTRE